MVVMVVRVVGLRGFKFQTEPLCINSAQTATLRSRKQRNKRPASIVMNLSVLWGILNSYLYLCLYCNESFWICFIICELVLTGVWVGDLREENF